MAELFQHKKDKFEVSMITLARNPETNGTVAVYKVIETMSIIAVPLSVFNKLFEYKHCG